MHFDTLTEPEQRVLGCLIEKRFTTPDQYPLTLNALRLACNQATNRDPVVDYDEETVREAAQRLTRYGLARLASGHSSRATKYRHLAEDALALSREQLAVLSLLLLRGPQTPGEVRGRTERIVQWPSLAEVELVLAALIERGFAQRLDRRPGQKEERFAQLLGGDLTAEAAQSRSAPAAPPPVGAATSNGGRSEHLAAPGQAAGGTGRASAASGDPAGAAGAAGSLTGASEPDLAARLEALEARVEELAELLEQLTGETLTQAGRGQALT